MPAGAVGACKAAEAAGAVADAMPNVGAWQEWSADAVARWCAEQEGLGEAVASRLRAADVDGWSLATLSEVDMSSLGIQPFGVRRRLTLRARGLVGAKHPEGATPSSDGGAGAADAAGQAVAAGEQAGAAAQAVADAPAAACADGGGATGAAAVSGRAAGCAMLWPRA